EECVRGRAALDNAPARKYQGILDGYAGLVLKGPERASVQAESEGSRPPWARRFEGRGVLLAVLVGLVARVVLTTAIHHWGAIPVTSDDATYTRFAQTI